MKLSKDTLDLIKAICQSDVQFISNQLSSNFNNLKDLPELLERVHYGILKCYSNGEDINQVIQLAMTDWRDLLVSADFTEDIYAHIKWKDTILSKGA